MWEAERCARCCAGCHAQGRIRFPRAGCEPGAPIRATAKRRGTDAPLQPFCPQPLPRPSLQLSAPRSRTHFCSRLSCPSFGGPGAAGRSGSIAELLKVGGTGSRRQPQRDSLLALLHPRRAGGQGQDPAGPEPGAGHGRAVIAAPVVSTPPLRWTCGSSRGFLALATSLLAALLPLRGRCLLI